MAKMKRKSTMVTAPRDMAEAADFLAQVGKLTRNRNIIELSLNDQVAKLTDTAKAIVGPLDLQVEQLVAGLQLWAEANRAELTRNNATKTIKLATGDVAWRTQPPKVTIRGVEAVIEELTRLQLSQFLRSKVEIDKDAMLKEPVAAGKVAGVTIGSEGEDFVVTPASLDLPGAAIAA